MKPRRARIVEVGKGIPPRQPSISVTESIAPVPAVDFTGGPGITTGGFGFGKPE